MTDYKILAKGVQVYYGDNHAIKDVDVQIEDKTVTAFIGPSGCGKSTFLRTLNRMNDTINICRVVGDIRIDGEDIYDPRGRPSAAARKGRDGVSKTQSVPEIHLRQRGLWPENSRIGPQQG